MSFDVRGGDGGDTGGPSDGGTGPLSFGIGIAAGALAWVIGAAVLFVIGTLGLIGLLSIFVSSAPVAGTIAAYLSIHSWLITGMSVSSLGASGGSIVVLVLLTPLPISVLFMAGIASSVGNRQSALLGGLSVTIGYGLMTLLALFFLNVLGVTFNMGLFALEVTYDTGSMVTYFAFTGVVFPMVFGTAGALVG